MLRFYLSLVRDIPSVFRDSYEAWTFWILLIATPVVLAIWPEARPMTDSPWIISVPILMSVAYGMLRVNYSRFKALEEIICGLRSELSDAQQRLNTRTRIQEQKAQLGNFLRQLKATIDEYAVTHERSALDALEEYIYTWLTTNIGFPEAQLFQTAAPELPYPPGLPHSIAGPYQYASGRLKFLGDLLRTLGSN